MKFGFGIVIITKGCDSIPFSRVIGIVMRYLSLPNRLVEKDRNTCFHVVLKQEKGRNTWIYVAL
jgi:hypothetical protein